MEGQAEDFWGKVSPIVGRKVGLTAYAIGQYDYDTNAAIIQHFGIVRDVLDDEIVVGCRRDLLLRERLRPGDCIQLVVPADDAVYQLESSISSILEQPEPSLHILRRGAWSRRQERQCFRLESTIVPKEVVICLMVGDPQELESAAADIIAHVEAGRIGSVPFNAVIQDISAGGLRLAMDREVIVNDVVLITFQLARDLDELTVLGRAVWASHVDSAKRFNFQAGFQFIGVSRNVQDDITKFIFGRQAQLRRRGLM